MPSVIVKSVDIYIAISPVYAQPILKHLRALVHKACPQVEEKMKWNMPYFDYKGEMMCHMAAFKKHCAFGFWKAELMSDPKLMENARSEEAMGHFRKITSLKDLPPDKVIIRYIREAMKLNEQGINLSTIKKSQRKKLFVPDYFLKALNKNKKALKIFENFSYSHRKEYIEWLEGIKTEKVRNKNTALAVQMIAEGKGKSWKYEKKK